jgi:hypothetical protein
MEKKTPREYLYTEERYCNKCKQTKNRIDFHKDSYDKYGLQSKCKLCTHNKNIKYGSEHREYFKLKGKEKYKKSENPIRYQKYREAYLIRRAETSSSIRGRLLDLLTSARKRSKKHNLSYDLNIDWLLDLFEKQSGKCLLTNIELDFVTRPTKGNRYYPLSPSLDRINPSLGYTKDNVRLVCTAINLALNSFGEDFFEKIAKNFLQVRNNQNP